MTGNAPQNRDKLLITGIPPVADPPPETQGEPQHEPQHETRPESRPGTPAQPKAVFVDATGWRARLGRRFGLAAGAVLAVFLGALGLGMATGPSVPLTSWSEPSPRPRVELSPPDVPSEKPGERRAAEGSEPPGQAAANPEAGGRGADSAPSTPAPTTPLATPTPAPATSHPGNGRSKADPPAWGRKKMDR